MAIATALTIAMGLAKFVPGIIGLLKGSDAEKKAEEVLDLAKQVTGQDDSEAAVEALEADPALLVQYKEALLNHTLAMRQEDVKQLDIINQTMRAELTSKDPYNSRWRATFGYCVAYSWFLLFVAVVISTVYSVFGQPEKSGEIIKAMGEMMASTAVLWSVALAVLGITVKKRSDDKQTAAGLPTKGLLDLFKKE